MPVIRTINADVGLQVGGAPSIRVDDSIGRGVRALGGALSQAAEVQNEMQLRQDRMRIEAEEFRSDQGFRRFNDNMALDFTEQRGKMDPSGQGFAEAVSTQFNTKAEEFMASVPPTMRPKFAELLQTSRATWLNKAAATENDQRQTWYRDGIKQSQEQLQGQVFNDPALFDAAKQDGYRAIDSSGLSPAEKKVLREAWDDTLSLTVGEREVRDAEANPETAGDAANRLGVTGARGNPVDQFVDRIIRVESGGNPNARNPNSSAAGLGQFIDGTWLSMVRKHRPDVANGRSAQQIIALKTDPALSREMTRAYAQENSDFLGTQGLQATPGNIYLAHFLGPRGAAQVLKADPSAPIASVVGQDVVRANSFLKGKSASEVVAWASQKMGGVGSDGVPADPRYANLSLDKRLEIYDRTMAAAQRGQTAIAARTRAAYDSHKNTLELGIETGQVASDVTILNDPTLNDGDKASLLRTLRTRQGDAIATQQAVDAFGRGALVVDPYSSDGEKTVDNVWKTLSQTVPQEQAQASLDNLVRQTGVVPQDVVNLIRRGLTSQSVQDIMNAAQAAARISAIDPAALDRRAGGSEAQKAADDFRFYVNRLNLSPEDAARRMAENNKPERRFERKALEPAAKEFVKTLEDENLSSAFDESFLGWRSNPDLGFSPGQEYGIRAEYLAIAEDQFYAVNGDTELAKNRAIEEMKRLYGVTELTGRKVVMKHPPERYWPTFDVANAAQSLSYPAQLQNDVKAFDANADMNSIQLVTTPETDAMIKRGEMPAYSVLYTDDNGVLQTIPGRLWRPDISQLEEMQRRVDEQRQSERVINAERMRGFAEQDIQRNQILEQRQIDAGNALRGGPIPEVQPAAPAPRSSGLQPQTFSNQQEYLGVARVDSVLGRAILRRQQQRLRQDAIDSGILPGGG